MFTIVGPSIISERIYALLVFLVCALLIVALWRKVYQTRPSIKKLWYVPLSLWLANEVVYHFYPANVLEPTMTAFTLAAIYIGLYIADNNRRVGIQITMAVLAGLLVFGATLSKGLVALFPLAFYVLYWVTTRKISLGKAMGLSAVMFAALAASYGVILQNDTAETSLLQYFDSQVMASLNGERSYEPHFRSSRFYLVKRTFEVLIPNFILVAIILFAAYKSGLNKLYQKQSARYAILFLSIGLSASLPLAVSLKQSFYYLLPSMAYFALGLSILIGPAVDFLLAKPMSKKYSYFVSISSPSILTR